MIDCPMLVTGVMRKGASLAPVDAIGRTGIRAAGSEIAGSIELEECANTQLNHLKLDRAQSIL